MLQVQGTTKHCTLQSSNQILQFALFVKQHLHRKGCLHFLKITEQSVTYFKNLYIIKKKF